MFDEENNLLEYVEPGTRVKCVVHVDFYKVAGHPILGLAIRDRLGNEIIGINTETLDQTLPAADGKREYIISFLMPVLNKGEYTVTVAIANGYQADHVQMCWMDDVLVYKIADRKHDVPGLLYIENGEVQVFNRED